MSTRTLPSSPSYDWIDRLTQALMVLLGGLAFLAAALAALAVGFNIAYADRIYPGLSVAGIDLSGMTVEQAAAEINLRLPYQTKGSIGLQDGTQLYLAAPNELGLFLNPNASAVQALAWGRRGGPAARLTDQFAAWYWGVNLSPLLLYDERIGQSYLTVLASQIDRPAVDASLSVNGLDVVVTPGQIGRALDIPASLAGIKAQVERLEDGIVPLVITESAPAILDANEQAEIARRILSEPLKVIVPDAQDGDPGPWTFSVNDLSEMLTIERVSSAEGDRYAVSLNAERVRPILEEAAPALLRTPENARFIFNDDSRKLEVIQPAVIGRRLLVEETLQAINEELRQGEHKVPLVFETTDPLVTDSASGESLGITELVSSHTSYYYGSSAARIQNIKTAASRFHGVLVAPGATFSMAEILGDVSLDTGYAEALIIYGDRTIQGVGGGVCQVSTTLFRTVFFGGFPIVERHPHAYRVAYYELRADGSVNTNYAGLDATVFVPVVDFKFTNDTPYWLLMETYPSQSSLTWKFYSTSDGRTVDWDTTGLKNIVEPPDPLYEENPDLPKGTIKQVDWAVKGADVTITRMVYRDGKTYFTDTIRTHYLPWRAVFEYGPGTKIPKPDKDKGE